MSWPEQIEGDTWLLCERPWIRAERKAIRRHRHTGVRRVLKRKARRLMRRLGRLLLDDAPKKLRFGGYEY